MKLPRENGISKADNSLLLLNNYRLYYIHQEIYMLSYIELHVIRHNNTEMVLSLLDSDDTSTKLTFIYLFGTQNYSR